MKKIIIGVVVIAIILAGGYFLFNTNKSAPATQNTDQQPVTIVPDTTVTEPVVTTKTYDVAYTDTGYSPSNLTIKVGDTVNFKNESSAGDWVGSAMHPTHIVYSGTTLQQHCPDTANTSFDECKADKPGESWSFTFTKVGSWGYHNHVNAKHFGKITVE